MLLTVSYSVNKNVYSRELDQNYFQSNEFAERYIRLLGIEIDSMIHNDKDAYIVNEEGNRIYYATKTRNNFSHIENCHFVIVYLPRNKIYTNLSNAYEQNIQEMVDYIQKEKGTKVSIVEGKVTQAPEAIRENFEDYSYLFEGSYFYSNGEYYTTDELYEQKNWTDQEKVMIEDLERETIKTDTTSKEIENHLININYVDYHIEDFIIYMSYEEKLVLNSYDQYMIKILKTIEPYQTAIYVAVPICGLFIILMVSYLIIAIGYKKGKEGVELNDIDKIPLEIIVGIFAFILSIVAIITEQFYQTGSNYYDLFLSEAITAYLVTYVLIAIMITSMIKRIKAKTFLKNTILWRIWQASKKLYQKLKSTVINTFLERISITGKIALYGISYGFIMMLILLLFAEEIRDWYFN